MSNETRKRFARQKVVEHLRAAEREVRGALGFHPVLPKHYENRLATLHDRIVDVLVDVGQWPITADERYTAGIARIRRRQQRREQEAAV